MNLMAIWYQVCIYRCVLETMANF